MPPPREPSVVYDFDPYNLPQDLLAAIGLMTAVSAQAERIVQMLIAGCLGLDMEFGIAVTTHMPAPLRDHVARAVAEIRLPVEALDELDKLLDDLTLRQGKRNDVVHNSWLRHPDTEKAYYAKETARGTVSTTLVEVSVDQVKADAGALYAASMDLLRFVQRNSLIPAAPPFRPRGHKLKAARKARRKKAGSE